MTDQPPETQPGDHADDAPSNNDQTTHRPPIPTAAEYVAAFRRDRPDDCVSDH